MSVFWSVCRLSQFLSITMNTKGKIKRGTGVSLSDIFCHTIVDTVCQSGGQ